jgi:hypothetical protein
MHHPLVLTVSKPAGAAHGFLLLPLDLISLQVDT